MSVAGGVEVWEEVPGSWRWRYVEPPVGAPDAGTRANLPSHKGYSSAEAAASAARTAYPGVAVRIDAATPQQAPAGSGCRRAAARAAGAVVVLVVTAVLLRRRRSGRAGRRRVGSS